MYKLPVLFSSREIKIMITFFIMYDLIEFNAIKLNMDEKFVLLSVKFCRFFLDMYIFMITEFCVSMTISLCMAHLARLSNRSDPIVTLNQVVRRLTI